MMVVLAPVVLFAGAGNPPCSATAGPLTAGPSGPGGPGHYAKPLILQWGQRYQVGATEYGGLYGSISSSDPAQAYLPAHADTFAELSTLSANPYPSFTFSDADALGRLPYVTGLQVSTAGAHMVLYKRDIGYGQGPGQLIANGQPYRLDVYQPSATRLGVSKSPVTIELAATPGTGQVLGQAQAPALDASIGEQTCRGPGGVGNLFAHATNVVPMRIDQGVDYAGTGEIGALADAQITYVANPGQSGWPSCVRFQNGLISSIGDQGGDVTYQITDGPQKGRSVYLAENVTPLVHEGQHVSAGQPIATFLPGGGQGCIEIGWAATPYGDSTKASALGQQCSSGDPGCHSTYCGKTMSDLIAAGGAPGGIPQAGGIFGTSC